MLFIKPMILFVLIILGMALLSGPGWRRLVQRTRALLRGR